MVCRRAALRRYFQRHAWSLYLSSAHAAVPAAASPASTCGKTSAYIGFNGLLTTLDHNVRSNAHVHVAISLPYARLSSIVRVQC